MPRSLSRRPFALKVRRAPTEHHGCRVSIRREQEDEEGQVRTVEVHAVRGGETRRALDDYAMWWLDRYAEAHPGVTFTATLSANGLPARVRVPPDFPAIPLPESTAAWDRRRREEAEYRENRLQKVEARRQQRVIDEADRTLALRIDGLLAERERLEMAA